MEKFLLMAMPSRLLNGFFKKKTAAIKSPAGRKGRLVAHSWLAQGSQIPTNSGATIAYWRQMADSKELFRRQPVTDFARGGSIKN